jgi:hypothetical protein
MDPTEQLIGVIKRQPKNPNFLHTHRFRMVMHRTPATIYFMQEVNLPGISTGAPIQPTPFVDIPHHGDKLVFEDLTISFAVDEDMKNYREIWDWMNGLTFPQKFEQHKALVDSMYGKTTDILLVILNSNYNAQHYIMFRGAWPVSLGGLQFNTKDQDVAVQPVQATFKYAYYEFLDIENITP